MQTESGTLVRWLDDKGFGFIRPASGGNDIFIHISALRGMNRPPIVGDTIHYQTEIDAQGKVRAIHASIEGVPKQMTLESMVKKSRAAPNTDKSSKSDSASRRRTTHSGNWFISLSLLLLIVVGVYAYAYDKFGSRNTLTPNQSTMQAMPSSTPPEPSFQCEGKVYCSQMSSLEEPSSI